MTENNDKYVGMGTKVSPAMAEVINAICDAMGVDVYHMLQYFLYSLVRASNEHHQLSPEIQKLMTMLETDAGWQNAFNLCNPDGLEVSQIILILEQKEKKGFGAVMIDKPFMGMATQTESAELILERVAEVTMQGIYRKLRQLGASMGTKHLSDILLSMIDAQTIIELDRANAEAMGAPDNIAENGRTYAYGKKTKAKQHRTPDSICREQHIIFDERDREAAISEAGSGDEGDPIDFERMMGFRPIGDIE